MYTRCAINAATVAATVATIGCSTLGTTVPCDRWRSLAVYKLSQLQSRRSFILIFMTLTARFSRYHTAGLQLLPLLLLLQTESNSFLFMSVLHLCTSLLFRHYAQMRFLVKFSSSSQLKDVAATVAAIIAATVATVADAASSVATLGKLFTHTASPVVSQL